MVVVTIGPTTGRVFNASMDAHQPDLEVNPDALMRPPTSTWASQGIANVLTSAHQKLVVDKGESMSVRAGRVMDERNVVMGVPRRKDDCGKRRGATGRLRAPAG